MQESTIIIQKEKQEIILSYVAPKDATLLARKSGLTGRLEIQHWIKERTEEVLYSLYMINEQNKIVGAIYPYIASIRDFIFDQVIPAKSKQQPHKVIDIIRFNRERNNNTLVNTLRCPNVIGNY